MNEHAARPENGLFLTIDGGDGVGKSTQIRLLCEWLSQQGRASVTCRDPGSTPLGEAVREILLHRHDLAIHRRSEMLLYMAARAQLVEEVVRPALAAGKVVVSDRFLLANVVYQGAAGGLDVEAIWEIGRLATDGLLPQLTVVLDLPPAAAAARITRPLDRMEQQGIEFHTRVREGFLREAARQSQQALVLNADATIEVIQSQIRAAVAPLLLGERRDPP